MGHETTEELSTKKQRIASGWNRRFKGSDSRGGAWIWTHADAKEGRAIVQNHHGFSFAGNTYPDFASAARAARGAA